MGTGLKTIPYNFEEPVCECVSLVLYMFEMWFLAFREENNVQMLESKVVRKIFGREKDEVRLAVKCTIVHA